ncbi:MAG: alpha/beta fold hydrolase [Planctomycetes bacterium]|nr:alpha/beta fold hydrolase [Planctomycetota bacterium]
MVDRLARLGFLARRSLFMLALGAWLAPAAVWAQEPATPAAPGAAAAEDEPEDISRMTKDGVKVVGTYYKSDKGKEAIPVILIHGANGSRKEMAALAVYLNKNHNHAVLNIDLRGHGESTQTRDIKKKILAESMPPVEYTNMITQDLETWKAYLMELNNAGKLNIDKLAMVGSDMGAIVAMLFADQDWSWPVTVASKQGQDVKVVVMISPDFNFKTLRMNLASRSEARTAVSLFIVVGGDDTKSTSDATRVLQLFERGRRPTTDPADKDIFLHKEKTRLQGTKMLGQPALGIDKFIGGFIDLRAGKIGAPWKDRPSPL